MIASVCRWFASQLAFASAWLRVFDFNEDIIYANRARSIVDSVRRDWVFHSSRLLVLHPLETPRACPHY